VALLLAILSVRSDRPRTVDYVYSLVDTNKHPQVPSSISVMSSHTTSTALPAQVTHPATLLAG
jgi:hypothetical protein